jgi:enamine deaminase RidA (YjgF/YER057c/UK114 family)
MWKREGMEAINPESLVRPRGYSHGMLRGGRTLFVAGQVGWRSDGRMVPGGFVEQFDQALANVLTIAREAGGAADAIGRLTIYVTDKGEYLASQRDVGERYRTRMGRHYPAMTLVEVKSLLVVEVEATAVV